MNDLIDVRAADLEAVTGGVYPIGLLTLIHNVRESLKRAFQPKPERSEPAPKR
jgi:hypothetical protein